jgi:hypothetical protein
MQRGIRIIAGWIGITLAAVAAPRPKDKPAKAGPEEVLRTFLKALADKDTKAAYEHVAPSTKDGGDPIAYQAKCDFASFANEAKAAGHAKFAQYKLGEQKPDGENKVRILLHFAGGDNDETMLIRVGGRWYVADPIHIIR